MSHTEPTTEGSSEHLGIKDRRKTPRFDASNIPNLRIIIQGDTHEAKVINISRGGALIECSEHMSPGSSISLHLLVAKTAYNIEGRITRSGLSSTNNQVPQYQSAIAFDKDFTLLPAGIDMD
jgi:hypothetical protein